MARDDDNFDDLMKGRGVRPLAKKSSRAQPRDPRKERAERSRVEADEDREFLEAVGTLDGVPDKDGLMPSRPESGFEVERVTLAARAELNVMGTLDLHGMIQQRAREALARYLMDAYMDRTSPVIVVTGKGHHSRDGVAVLKPMVEGWLHSEGRVYVKAVAEAPRGYGGGGALIVWLRENI